MFKTETHLHLCEVSPCAQLSAEEMIRLYAEAGYHTVFVSDHLKDRCGDIPTEQKADLFMAGYEAAVRAGEKYGVTVLFAAELQLNESPKHFLLYNIDRAFLMGAMERFDLSIAEFYAYAKTHGVTVVQAHPYRDGLTEPTDAESIDALEAYNSNPRHDNLTPKAVEYAKANGLPMTGGSDAHRTEDVGLGGVITPFPIESAEDYVRALMQGEIEIIGEVAQ